MTSRHSTSTVHLHDEAIAHVSDLSVPHICRQHVHFVRVIGEGAFGRVYLANCKGLATEDETTQVAVKTLKVCRKKNCHIYVYN